MKNMDELSNIFFFGEKLIQDEKFELIKKFIESSGVLQSQPQIARKIIDASNNSDSSVSDFERIVSSDPVIAAKILKMANSSFYKLSREVSSVKRAILILGITMIKDIALSIAILDMFKTKNKGLMSELWEHAVSVSIGAKLLSANFADEVDSEVCFTAGLLHDIGKMMMAKNEKYLSVTRTMSMEGPRKCLEVEEEIFGFNHAELGAVMAKIWDFSPEMHYIIYNHHDIEMIINVDTQYLSVPHHYVWNTAVISVTDLAAHYLGIGSEPIDFLSLPLLKFLGFQSKEFFIESFTENFKNVYFKEKILFD